MKYILLGVVILLLFTHVNARTIYKVYESGQCLVPASPIISVSTCEQQAELAGWSDTSATSVSFSSYLPTGCILQTSTNDLRVYPKESSLSCSSDYKCLCEITAPDCIDGINRISCLCANNLCTRDTGLVCSSGNCEHAPACVEGANDDVCQCGNSKDCTPDSGLKCSDNICSHAEICPNRIGTVENVDTCRCGSKDCSSVIGSYCHSESSTCRAACPGGTFVNHLLECSSCESPGYYCPSGSTMSPTEYKCPAGRFGDITGLKSANECKGCAAGRYSIIPGITSAEHCTGRCSAGKWSSETGLASDELCLGRCPTGTYSYEMGLTGADQCTGRCSAGKWSSFVGLTSDEQCSLCGAGKWSSEIGGTSESACSGKCLRGTYSDQFGLISHEQCKVCAVNKYQDELGATICKGCLDNKIIVDTATPSLHDSEDDCQIAVPICTASQYLENNECRTCEASFTCDGTVKQDCPPGFFCSGNGSAIACPMGRYGELKSQTTMEDACKACLPGTYQNVIGQTYCSKGCPRGKFGQIVGAKNEQDACTQCPLGFMCASLSMNRPTACPLGSYQNEYGQELCKFCPIDTYSDEIGLKECRPCGTTKEGQSLRTSGLGANSATQCEKIAKACPLNQRPDSKGQCNTCPKGFYGNGKGTRCILCPKGYAQPNEGSNTCQECQTKKCQQLYGSADFDEYTPKEWKPNFQKMTDQIDSNPFPVEIIIVYGSLAFVVILIIGSHRLCPDCFKHADVMFSGDHLVEDTHARRILNTRLGAAFTVSIPFIVAILAVFVFTSDNQIVTNGLLPIAITEIPNEPGLYKNIYITFKTESAAKAQDCSDIYTETSLNCSDSIQLLNPYVCQIETVCNINPPFGGQHTFYIHLADHWQNSMAQIVTAAWNHTKYNITNVIKTSEPLAGTMQSPTVIDYDAIRSKNHDHQTNYIDYGLQMTTRNTNFISTETGTEFGTHVTALRFFSTETLFVRETESKLGIITRIGTVLTLTLSAISGLRVAKLNIEKCIDTCYSKIFKKVPKDIHRRVSILEEKSSKNVSMTNMAQKEATKQPDYSKTQIHTDSVTGKKYTYNPITRKSIWIKEEL